MSSVSTPQPLAAPSQYTVGSPIGTATTTEGEGINLGDVTRILKQRRLTIIITSVLLYMLVVVATVLIGKYFPAYSSEAIFELEPPMTGDAFDPRESEVNTKYMEQLLRTEAAKIRNAGLMLKVVELPEIKATEYFRWYNSNVREAADGLEQDLVSAPMPDTRLIRVALSCKVKSEARLIVEKVVDTYYRTFRDDTAEEMRGRTEGLKNTLAELESDLEEKRAELKNLRQTANIPAWEVQRLEARQHVVYLKAQLGDLDAQIGALQSQIDSLQGIDPAQLPLTAEQKLIIESDPILRFWRSQVENLDVELDALAHQLGPNHRQVTMLRERRDGYMVKENAKREELIREVRMRQIEQLRQEMARSRNMQARLQDQLNQVQATERDLDRNLQVYQEMLHDEERLGEQLGEVQSKLTEVSHASRDPSRVRLWLRQSAQEAIRPSRPNYIIYLGGGFVLAIAGGIGLAFLRELTDQAIRTPVDVARFCHLSVLGSVPQLQDEEAEEVEEIEEAVRKAPHSLVAEAFRRTRTNLQFSGPVETQRTLLITSPNPEDGKTAVAINLATTMAHSSLKVLLIDCNFRRPSLRALFANTRPEGLSNVLIGQGALDDYITHTDLPTLDVLTTGPMPPTPAELLGSEKMRQTLASAIERYDRVLLDGPPALLISDVNVLATQVNGVILVARAEQNSRGVLKRARDSLEGVNARVVGVILNGVKTRAGGYFKKQYREFYDYTSDETIPAELPEPTAKASLDDGHDEDEA